MNPTATCSIRILFNFGEIRCWSSILCSNAIIPLYRLISSLTLPVTGGRLKELPLRLFAVERDEISATLTFALLGGVWTGSGQNIEKQNIESQNIERKISKAKYRNRKISKPQNIEVAKYRIRKISKSQNIVSQNIEWQDIEYAKYRRTKYRMQNIERKISNAKYRSDIISKAKYRSGKISNAKYRSG